MECAPQKYHWLTTNAKSTHGCYLVCPRLLPCVMLSQREGGGQSGTDDRFNFSTEANLVRLIGLNSVWRQICYHWSISVWKRIRYYWSVWFQYGTKSGTTDRCDISMKADLVLLSCPNSVWRQIWCHWSVWFQYGRRYSITNRFDFNMEANLVLLIALISVWKQIWYYWSAWFQYGNRSGTTDRSDFSIEMSLAMHV